MKVSLKNARLLAKNLDALINPVGAKCCNADKVVQLSDFDNPKTLTSGDLEAMYDAGVTDHDDLVKQAIAMTDVVFNIRNKVAVQNAAHGIDAKVARSAQLNRQIGVYNNLLRAVESSPVTETKLEYLVKVARRLVAIATGTDTSGYGRTTSVNMRLIDEDRVRQYKKQRLALTQELEAVRAELAQLNSKLEIELTDSEVCVLEFHSLL